MTLTLLAILFFALLAATFGGVVGFGTALLLLPVLTFAFGPRTAVTALGIAMILANASRAGFSWREIDWKAVAAYAGGGIPMSVLGAFLYVGLDAQWLGIALGALIILLVPLRRFAERRQWQVRLVHLPLVGGAVGIISGIGGAIGPAAAPFLVSYGLVRGSYLGTEALSAMLIHVMRSGVYAGHGAVTASAAVTGVGLGVVMMAGAYLGRRLVDRMDAHAHIRAIEAFMIVLGLAMIATSFAQ